MKAKKIMNYYKENGMAALVREGASRWTIIPYYINNIMWNAKNTSGRSVLDYDWDNLILLDGCRYDEFIKRKYFPEQDVNQRVTLGHNTPTFLYRNFGEVELHDIVYCTANPQVLKFVSEHPREVSRFHDVVSLLDKWDNETQTILPSTVYEEGLKLQKKHPQKRFIFHFLQPHVPFLGEKADEIEQRIGKRLGGLDPHRDYTFTSVKRGDPNRVSHTRMAELDVGVDEYITAYRETMDIVIEYAMKLAEEIDGKTALTSDHGWNLGERSVPFFGPKWLPERHEIRTDELCKVPYIEFDWDERKRVIEEDPSEKLDIDRSKIGRRLTALGYK